MSVQIQCLLTTSCNFLQKMLDFLYIVYTTISADGPFSLSRSHNILLYIYIYIYIYTETKIIMIIELFSLPCISSIRLINENNIIITSDYG